MPDWASAAAVFSAGVRAAAQRHDTTPSTSTTTTTPRHHGTPRPMGDTTPALPQAVPPPGSPPAPGSSGGAPPLQPPLPASAEPSELDEEHVPFLPRAGHQYPPPPGPPPRGDDAVQVDMDSAGRDDSPPKSAGAWQGAPALLSYCASSIMMTVANKVRLQALFAVPPPPLELTPLSLL